MVFSSHFERFFEQNHIDLQRSILNHHLLIPLCCLQYFYIYNYDLNFLVLLFSYIISLLFLLTVFTVFLYWSEVVKYKMNFHVDNHTLSYYLIYIGVSQTNNDFCWFCWHSVWIYSLYFWDFCICCICVKTNRSVLFVWQHSYSL